MEPSPISVEASSPPALAPDIALKSKTAAIEAFESITYGSIAGILGKYIEYPFDTVKVRLQSQPDSLPLRYKGPLDCFRQSLQTDGFLGMYRGISAPLVGAAAETSSLFVFETIGREILYATGYSSRDTALSLPALYVTGGFAGALTSYVLTPIELVKCRIQVPSSQAGQAVVHLRPLAVVRDVFRHEGIRGFWHGQLGTLIRETGGSAAWFGAKETVTAMFRQVRAKKAKTQTEKEKSLVGPLPLWQQLVAGASAGVSYNFLFFPADTIKSRMQTMPTGPNIPRSTFWGEGAAIWNKHGIRGLYRGCGITCLRSAPASAVIFTIFDSLKTHLPMQ